MGEDSNEHWDSLQDDDPMIPLCTKLFCVGRQEAAREGRSERETFAYRPLWLLFPRRNVTGGVMPGGNNEACNMLRLWSGPWTSKQNGINLSVT